MDWAAASRNLTLGFRAAVSPSARLILRQNFDRTLYLQTYPDVARSKWPPFLHYLWHGYRELRDPGPSFSSAWYLRKNGDVLRMNLCPLLHYAVFGQREGRLAKPSSRFGPTRNLSNAGMAAEIDLWPVDRPLVSVVVPCFNYGHLLGRCLESLAQQTFSDFEVLVIEGGSTDQESVARVQNLESGKRPNTRFLYRSSSRLVGDNRNYGIAEAKGKYICCLDADDTIHPVFLEVGVFTAEVEDFDIVSPSVRCFGDSDIEWILQAPTIEKLSAANCISTAALFRRKVWEKTGGYRDWGKGRDHIPEDWDFWMRALGHGFRAAALAAPLHRYFVHEGGLSREGDRNSHRVKLIEANRDLIDSAHPARARNFFINPLANLQSRPGAGGSPAVLFCMPWITQGGAENHLRAIATGLNRDGIPVAVLTTAELLPGMPDDTERFESDGIVIYNLPELIANPQRWPLFIRELLHRHNVATLFLCGSEYIYRLLPTLRAEHPGLHIVDQLFNDEGHLVSNRGFAPFIDLTVVPSTALRDTLVRTEGEAATKVRLIPQALLPSFDDDTGLDADLLDAIRGKFVVSFIGRFSPEKAPGFFTELAKRLSLTSPDYYFLLVGDGPLRQQVIDSARALKGRYYAPGTVRNARAYIAASDVIVVPSRLEGLPGVVLETLAAGRALVASRVGAIPEAIVDGVNGILCEHGDMSAFFAGVERLRTDQRLRVQIENNAKAGAPGDSGYEAMSGAYRAALTPVLKPDQSPPSSGLSQSTPDPTRTQMG